MVELSLSQNFPGAVAAFPHKLEAARLNELRRLGILDTEHEQRFDDITQLAAQVFNTPIALISLVDANRQWFKSNIGLDAQETHRDLAFCSHAIHEKKLLIIENALLDARFNTNPLVVDEPRIRFYAGAVIRSNGLPLGTLCLIDREPHSFSKTEQKQLLGFAKLIENEIASNTIPNHERTYAQLRADYDPLTHFLTRKAFKINLNYQLSHQSSDTHPQHIIYIRINDLNRLNIEYGRYLGDFALVEFSRRVKSIVQGFSHLIGRLDVSTFGIAIYHATPSAIHALIDSLDTQMSEPFNFNGITQEISITSLLQTCETYMSANEIISSCEYATRLDHSLRQNGTHIINPDQQQQINLHNQIRRKLATAIDSHQLTLHFQPKVDAHHHQLIGLEALLRWTDPELGEINPIDIIDAATDLDLNTHLTEWVIAHTCQQMSIWKMQNLPLVPVAINLDEYQLRLPEFPGLVNRILDQYSIPADLIEFEITEHTFMRDMPAAIHNMLALQKSGITFSIDDFGTGYSALSSLYRVPINTIKIDKSFIDNIEHNVRNSAIVNAIITFCRNAGLNVLAEGLEHTRQYKILQSFQCDQLQGFLFSRPLTSDQTQTLLHNNTPLPLSVNA